MSLLSDSPYFVQAPFQSDSWRHYFTRKTEAEKVENNPNGTESKWGVSKELNRVRALSHAQFIKLNKLQELWSNEFKNARKGLYEVLYLKNNILYQGHSVPINIHRDSRGDLAQSPEAVLCELHESGDNMKNWTKMWVPKYSNKNQKDQVLWSRGTPDM